MTQPTLSSDERRRRVPFLTVLGERERERASERASEREQPSTPAHAARTLHPARAAAARTPMPTTRTRQAHSLPPRPPLPGRPPAAAAPGRNAGPDAAAHPLRPSRHRAHLNARHPRPPDPGPRTPPPQRRRAPARHRTVPRPIAWDARGSIVSGATAARPRAAKPSRRSDPRPRSRPPRPSAALKNRATQLVGRLGNLRRRHASRGHHIQ